MSRYDATKVQEALQLVKNGTPHAEVVEMTGMGLSTLSRHITEYRAGNRPDVDVGELPPPKSNPKAARRGGSASLVRVIQRRSATTHAEQMMADAGSMDEEAGRLEVEAARLRSEAEGLRKAAKLLERAMAKAEGDA